MYTFFSWANIKIQLGLKQIGCVITHKKNERFLPFKSASFTYSLQFRTQNWIFLIRLVGLIVRKKNKKKFRLYYVYEYILLFLDLSLNNLWTKNLLLLWQKFSYIEKLLQLTAVIGIMKYERFGKYLFFL